MIYCGLCSRGCLRVLMFCSLVFGYCGSLARSHKYDLFT